MPPIRHQSLLWIAVLLTVLVISACCHKKDAVTTPVSDTVPACSESLCNITQTQWDTHIEPRHCSSTCPPKSIFESTYCGSLADGIKFCKELMNSASCTGTQSGTRIAYTATLASDVGTDANSSCAKTKNGTVIYDPSTKNVVTQHPGFP